MYTHAHAHAVVLLYSIRYTILYNFYNIFIMRLLFLFILFFLYCTELQCYKVLYCTGYRLFRHFNHFLQSLMQGWAIKKTSTQNILVLCYFIHDYRTPAESGETRTLSFMVSSWLYCSKKMLEPLVPVAKWNNSGICSEIPQSVKRETKFSMGLPF